jgi:S-adenosylmethionine:tRNA ribosyltransferase-isomerase
MIQPVQIEDYQYELPASRIAKYPLMERDGSKLLVYDRGHISHRLFRELTGLLEKKDLLVFNDTRVVQARLMFRKETGSSIEIFCLEPYDPADYYLAFQKTSESVWKCLVGNAKKWKEGSLVLTMETEKRKIRLEALKSGREKDAFLIRFSWNDDGINFGEILEMAGKTPIPPYLEREAEFQDRETYQTVYSRFDGSVAAPTAGFHFTNPLLDELEATGIPMLNLTLHVGAGTFQPVASGRLEDHPMHAEHFYVNKESLESILNHRGRILAVGTTSTRILESIFWLGSRLTVHTKPSGSGLFLDQWEAYQLPEMEPGRSLEQLLTLMEERGWSSLEGMTRLMIVPGYRFRLVNRLLTNYHQPRSTLLLLVAAFIGEDWRKVYQYALNNDFRFLSYGDSSLLIPSG